MCKNVLSLRIFIRDLQLLWSKNVKILSFFQLLNLKTTFRLIVDYKYAEISSLKQKTENFDSEFPRGWFPLCYSFYFDNHCSGATETNSRRKVFNIWYPTANVIFFKTFCLPLIFQYFVCLSFEFQDFQK